MSNRIMIIDDSSSKRPSTMQGNFEIFVNAIKEKMRTKLVERIEKGEATLTQLFICLGKPRLIRGYRVLQGLDEPYAMMGSLKDAAEAGDIVLQTSSWGEREAKEGQCQGRLPGLDDLAPKELIKKNANDCSTYSISIEKDLLSVEINLSYHDVDSPYDFDYPCHSYWSWQHRKFEFDLASVDEDIEESLLQIYKEKIIDQYVNAAADRLLDGLAEKLASEGVMRPVIYIK